jgi:pyruvate/2-oxoglutarate dehydrogenase complex dihydrolipoamide dehydrogenase (E3) component
MKSFDAIVIGAGQAGPSMAGRLTGAGMKVALIERKLVGGTCVNYGCMPTKTLVASARAAYVARRGGEYGVQIAGDVGIDMPVVKGRADTVIHNARQGLEDWFQAMEGLTFIRGHAQFIDSKTITVNGEQLTAPRIFLNVGGRPSIPNMPGLDGVDFLTSTTILALDKVPRHLAVIGGSYIALEFAQMYRRFGAEVTIIERGERLASREDADISQAIEDIMIAEGVAVHKNATDVSFRKSGTDTVVAFGGAEIAASHVLIATGRAPNTDDLGLDKAGVKTDSRGFIVVDDRLSTTVDGIWRMAPLGRRKARKQARGE